MASRIPTTRSVLPRGRPVLTALAALVVASAGALPRTAVGQGSSWAAPRRIDTTVALAGTATVELGLVAGHIRVTTWNRNAARIVAEASSGRLELDATPSHLELRQQSGRDGVGSATYDVTVPAGVRLSLDAISGDVSACGARGPVEITTVSGSARVTGSGRTLSVGTVSGGVDVIDAGGDVRASSVSGSIRIRNVPGVLETESVSGSIQITGSRGDRVRGETVSGAIAFTGALAPAGRYSFGTHSGRITLRIPPTTGADLSADTFSGVVAVDVPGAVRRPEPDGESRTSYHYVLGRGGAHVSVSTFSGAITITSNGAQ